MTWYRLSPVKAVAVLLLLTSPIHAQDVPPSGQEAQANELVRLFLDCQGSGCYDRDFFTTEIQFVDWVSDRSYADLHLLITSQATGGGGRAYDLFFIGEERFENMADTLEYFSGPNDSSDTTRRGLLDMMKIGLMRFVGLTPVASQISIGLRRPGPGARGPGGGPGAMATPEDDPWNFWVFRTSLSGHGSGESTYRSLGLTGSFTASRVTEEWKVSISARTSYSESKFDYDDVSTLSVTRRHSLSGLLVKSLTDHWSAGLRAGASSSTYTNYRLALNAAPVLEYNVFPYAESTRRMLTFQYSLEASYFDYVEETIFFKTSESIMSQALGVELEMRQPWGSASVYGSGSHFLRNIRQHNLGLGGSLDLRIGRGLSVRLSGFLSRIQDLVSVPGGTATVEDVLLRRKQLQTDYQFFASFGVGYTFGSIFSNVVNPRIGGSSSGGIIIIG